MYQYVERRILKNIFYIKLRKKIKKLVSRKVDIAIV
jgi:hypothetical protein